MSFNTKFSYRHVKYEVAFPSTCMMGNLVKLLVTLVWGVVFFLGLRSIYNDSVTTGVVLVVLSLPLLFSATKKSLKLPPGPRGLPIVGYLPFLGSKPQVTFQNLAKKYGPLMYVQMGSFDG